MRKDKFIILGLATALTLSSCSDSFLEVQKPDGDPLEEYYKTPEHIEEAVIAAYDPIHWHDWGLGQYNAYNIDSEIMGDDFWVGGSNYGDMLHWHMLGNYVADAEHTLSTLWSIDYSGVKRCNDAIQYIANADLADKDYARSCEMQTRCLRVFYYNNLWHLFGNVPYYLQSLNEPPYVAPQLSADEVYNNVIVELEEILASNVLPMKWDSHNAGRVSQAFAIMLYAEMVGYQNDESRFGKAYDYLKTLIGSNQYALFPDFKAYWDTDNEWNSESIWEINYDQTISERDWGSGQSIGGMVIPTLISPNNYKGNDDWSAGQDGWGFLPVRAKVADELLKNDGRLEGTVWDMRDEWNSHVPTNEKPTLYVQRDADTHLWLQKYRPYDKNNANGTSSKNLNYANNFRYYRYAEALLYAAEFAIRSGKDAAGTGEAKTWLNMVRSRANLSDVSKATVNDIFTERHKEFVGEGKRYFDLVRAEQIPEVQSENKATGVLVPVNNADEGVTATSATRTNAWTPQKKYIPIAQSDIDATKGTAYELQQNNY